MKRVDCIKNLTLLLLVVFISACASQQAAVSTNGALGFAWDENFQSDLEVAAVGTTYYVSGSGRDTNDGKSPGRPFKTLQKAAGLTNPGDTVFIMNGTYINADTNILNISRSGEPGKWIRYKAYPGHTPKLKSSKNWHGVSLSGVSYILIEGLTLEGNNDNVTEAQARTQLKDTDGDGKIDAMEPKPEYSGNGIGITRNADNLFQISHHIIIRKNTIFKFGGGGIYTYGADFITAEDNILYDNGWYSPYGNSGISFYQNQDSQPGYAGYRMVVRRNISSGNRNFLPCSCFNYQAVTDGNGIIIDDSRNTQNDSPYGVYSGRTLVVNNIVNDNWGRGIHVFESDNVDIINNTSYSNSYHPEILDGEITAINASNVRAYNNIMNPFQYRKANTVANATNVIFDYNLVFGGYGLEGPKRNNITNANPRFVNANAQNFKLQDSSPAIDKGRLASSPKDDLEKSTRPKGAGVDIGAYELR